MITFMELLRYHCIEGNSCKFSIINMLNKPLTCGYYISIKHEIKCTSTVFTNLTSSTFVCNNCRASHRIGTDLYTLNADKLIPIVV
jgi:hypothetical protein